MGKFYSVPNMAPSGGEGKMGGGRFARQDETVTPEMLRKKHPEYYANRPEVSTAPFVDVGERMKFRGDEALVRHVERNADGSQEVIVQRSAQVGSGTYKLKTAPDRDRTQQITSIKPTTD